MSDHSLSTAVAKWEDELKKTLRAAQPYNEVARKIHVATPVKTAEEILANLPRKSRDPTVIARRKAIGAEVLEKLRKRIAADPLPKLSRAALAAIGRLQPEPERETA